jgi:hypothetical protein
MSETLPQADLPSPERDAEIASARAAFRELDKAWRATRTYGLGNTVTKRFFEQLQALMIAHLESWPVLAVIVDRAELLLYGESVYDSEDALGESLAFRLYGDGVREVRFEYGLSPEDLHAFLDALWVRDDSENADDDVVTRLWAKDLATISVVTAEDIVQAPWSEDLTPQEHGFFAPPPASFEKLVEREKTLAAGAEVATGPGPAAAGENLKRNGPSGLVGFEVKDHERARLERELAAESAVDGKTVVLAMLRAIVASQQPPGVRTRALEVVPAVLDVLLAEGRWPALAEVLEMLEIAQANEAFELTHRQIAQRVLESINLPQRVALIQSGLEGDAARPLDGLAAVFARLTSAAVAPLCTLLANLTDEEQRAALRDTLIRLGAENPEPVLKGLADRRPQYVLDLITVIVAWQQPQAAGVLSMLADHPAAAVRAEALTSLARLHQKGDGGPLLAFASDAVSEVRQQALRLLASGRYKTSWEAWRPHLPDGEELLEQARADKRGILLALRATADDAAIPYLKSLIEGRRWKQRQKKEEAALIAIKELAALGTPRAWQALEEARANSGGSVRKACLEALIMRKP